jgi:hypothetical protein
LIALDHTLLCANGGKLSALSYIHIGHSLTVVTKAMGDWLD